MPEPRDTAFEMATSNIRFGSGVTAEIGMDLADLGAKRVLVFTDRRLATLQPVDTVCQSLRSEGIGFDVYDAVRVEPTDQSLLAAVDAAKQTTYDGFVAVGGGSVIDTAKVANLLATYPAELMEYVNAPLGQGKPVPGPLKPLIAVPTTAGTGSETTGVAIFDLTSMHAKTGIAHRRLKPTLGLVDPENTRTLPPLVAASTGLDVLCHALESYTALPFDQRPRPARPLLRPAYQGANPISDIWSLRALELTGKYLPRVYADSSDEEARSNMLLAATMAGMGFGNAGVHLCHGMSYPVSGMVRNYQPEGYPEDHPLVPHGISVVLQAPAVFRFTSQACPQRHLRAAQALGMDVTADDLPQIGERLAAGLVELIRSLGLPSGLEAIGFTADDIPQLVAGTLPQHRVTKLSPRPASEDDLRQLFTETMRLW